jgi:cell division protein FtsZ
VLGKKTPLLQAFKAANDVLLGAVQGIADLIMRPGMINVDFADVRTVMSEMGMAMMGTGAATGEDRAREAAEMAIRSPLLDDINLQGARGILVNITAGPDMDLGEFSEVGDIVEEFASDDATVVVGTVVDESLGDELRVTVVATGLGSVVAQESPLKMVDSKPAEAAAPPNYRDLDRPTIIRERTASGRDHGAAAAREAIAHVAPADDRDMEYLDIPAFLRRQAD